ncbi:MAG: flagellar biosynthetic protein FliO [Acidobacteria bacterium]|nr:flagellar biosynthetic protein FliO [Acidobacteriota bacterium]
MLAVVYFLLWQQIDPTQSPTGTVPPLLGDTGSLFLMMLKTCFMLLLVIVLLYGTLRFLPRIMGMPVESQLMKVVGRYSLEPQKSLYIVEVAGKHLLLGVTQERIELISELETSVIQSTLEAATLAKESKPSIGSSAIKEFSKYLRR